MLECKSISVTYGKKIRALKEFSFDIKCGEIVALIGANGAGKSTLLKTVSGLHKVDQGEILFEKLPIQNMPAHQVASHGISHVPEGRRLFSRMTVLENLSLGSYLNSKGLSDRLEKVFALFPILKERIGQLGGTLSGGEQQMCAMARGLMSEPKLLMLDEPSMGLAPILVEKIFKIIRQINEMGTTILLVEQNALASLNLAHRGYILETGSIFMEGTGKDLLKDKKIQQAYLGT